MVLVQHASARAILMDVGSNDQGWSEVWMLFRLLYKLGVDIDSDALFRWYWYHEPATFGRKFKR